MGKKSKGPILPDIQTKLLAGIDSETGQPLRMKDEKSILKFNIKKLLKIIDRQDAVNRYVWYNLPNNITSQELERLIYLKGQLCFFYNETLEQFFFMPYALDGTIDFYGRFNRVHPVPMTSGTEDEGDKSQASILSSIKLDVVYGIEDIEEYEDKPEEFENKIKHSCVLLRDYCNDFSQTIEAREVIHDPIIDTMANMIPFLNTKLILSTGIRGVRVADADQGASVVMDGFKVENFALKGMPWIPFVGQLDFQELALQSGGQAQDYLMSLQALDNFRLSLYGIDNGGLFEKKAHELQSQADLNGVPVGLVLQDGLSIRQNFCNIVNSLFDLEIWCEPAENIQGVDTDGDGVIFDENTGENSGIEMGDSND